MKAKENIKATARVELTVEVIVSAWGGDCTTSQVFNQASKEAIQILHQVFTRASGKAYGIEIDPCDPNKLGPNVRIVSKPKVTMVLVREKE